MPKFVTHEAISCGAFNVGFSGGVGPLLPWQEVLTNSERTLEIMMTRMQSDFEGMQAKQRKCWGQKEVETWSLIDVSTMCFRLAFKHSHQLYGASNPAAS